MVCSCFFRGTATPHLLPTWSPVITHSRKKGVPLSGPADVPKWLRGSPAKRVCSACAGSNPAVCDFYAHTTVRCRPVVRIPGFHPGDPGSNPGGGVCLPMCVRACVFSPLVFSPCRSKSGKGIQISPSWVRTSDLQVNSLTRYRLRHGGYEILP